MEAISEAKVNMQKEEVNIQKILGKYTLTWSGWRGNCINFIC